MSGLPIRLAQTLSYMYPVVATFQFLEKASSTTINIYMTFCITVCTVYILKLTY